MVRVRQPLLRLAWLGALTLAAACGNSFRSGFDPIEQSASAASPETVSMHWALTPADFLNPAAPTPEELSSSPSDAAFTESPDVVQTGVIRRVCRVTAYHDQGETASGLPSGVGQCAAPRDIPIGSRVFIPALNKTFIVTDRTHRRFRNSTVDLFVPCRDACKQFGRNFLEVEITPPAARLSRTELAQIVQSVLARGGSQG